MSRMWDGTCGSSRGNLIDILAIVIFMQKMAVQTAQSGGSRRPRRDEDQRSPAVAAAPGYGGEADGYSSFSRGRDRDGGRGSSYGDTWGNVKGGSKGGEGCYNCGEVGAICPF